MSEIFVLHLRGLPWAAGKKDITDFLDGICIVNGYDGIHLPVMDDGKASGEAYVEVESESDLETGLRRDKENMGKRYIEVKVSSKHEMDVAMKTASVRMSEPIVKLRGLPYGCTEEDIANFFSGLKIKPNGIILLLDEQGRPTGKGHDAFVEFVTCGKAAQAMDRHKKKMGHRYVEVFKSNQLELRTAVQQFERAGYGMIGLGRHLMGGRSNFEGNSRMYGRMGNLLGGMEYDMGDMMGSSMQNMRGGMDNMRGNMDFMDMGNMRGQMDNMDMRGGMGYMDNVGQGTDYMAMRGQMGGMGMGNMKGGMGNMDMGYMNEGNMRGNMGGNLGSRPGPYDRPGSGVGGSMGRNLKGYADSSVNRRGMSGMSGRNTTSGNCRISMLGLPFSATEEDIIEFFSPLKPDNQILKKGKDGRASGKASVDFKSHQEAKMAMTKNNDNMGHRYIQLFLDCDCETDEGMDSRQERNPEVTNMNQNPRDDQLMMMVMQEMRRMGDSSAMQRRGGTSVDGRGRGSDLAYGSNLSDRDIQVNMGMNRGAGGGMNQMSANNSLNMGMRGRNMQFDDNNGYAGMRAGNMDMGGMNLGMGGGNMDMRDDLYMEGNMDDYSNQGMGMRSGGFPSAQFTTKVLDAITFGGRRMDNRGRVSSGNEMGRRMGGIGGSEKQYSSPYD